jgi:hypothetical protein
VEALNDKAWRQGGDISLRLQQSELDALGEKCSARLMAAAVMVLV